MSEMMINREDATELGLKIRLLVKDLHARGFEKAHIGSAMVGIGAALVTVHEGPGRGLATLDGARDALLARTTVPQ